MIKRPSMSFTYSLLFIGLDERLRFGSVCAMTLTMLLMSMNFIRCQCWVWIDLVTCKCHLW